MQRNTTDRRPADLPSLDEPARSLGQPAAPSTRAAARLEAGGPSAQSEPTFTRDAPTLGAGTVPSSKRGAARRGKGWAAALLIVVALAAISFIALHQHRTDDGLTPGQRSEAAPRAIRSP